MADQKIIQINPELFKIQESNTTRKKRGSSSVKTNPIQMKVPSAQKKKNMSTSTLKRNILKMMRSQQEKINKDIVGCSNNTITTPTNSNVFNTDFNDSLNFLSKISAQKTGGGGPHNQTLRRYPQTTPINQNNMVPLPIGSSLVPLPVGSPLPNTPVMHIKSPLVNLPAPKYGCLKGGKLPTYRLWNQTIKNHGLGRQPPMTGGTNNTPNNNIINHQHNHNNVVSSSASQIKPNNVPTYSETRQKYENDLVNQIKGLSFTEKAKEKTNVFANGGALKKSYIKRQKKTIKRTYRVGKSKAHPRISVLVSNKTIRMQTNAKSQQLKQTPMQDVKQYLLKNGFIKIGTNAPNDVLRKMFESAKMICGEVKNYNSENLLYNYFNDPKPL